MVSGGAGVEERKSGKSKIHNWFQMRDEGVLAQRAPRPGGPPHQGGSACRTAGGEKRDRESSKGRGSRNELLEQVESALHFASGMLVAAAGGDFDALQVDLAGFPDEAHAFQGLAAVKVSGCIVGVSRHK